MTLSVEYTYEVEMNDIFKKRFAENKSYRQIGLEIGKSYTYVMNILHAYYKEHPEFKPIKKISPPKLIIKGHSKSADKKTGDVSDILVDGYAARITERFTNCGNSDCIKCRRDANGKFKGHGPYTYLAFRNSDGQVISKYISQAKKQKLLDALAKSTTPINIHFEVLNENK